MDIPRPHYLEQLIERKENGSIKVITGIRRCGKSYLLFNLFAGHLRSCGVADDHIIGIALDDDESEELLDRHVLGSHVRSRIVDDKMHYVLLDEIQEVEGFERTLNGLARIPNLDIYVTGSNSKFLSSDVITQFRGRADEVRVRPLSFAEYLPAHGGSKQEAWKDYIAFGGLPLVLTRPTAAAKANYLASLFKEVYLIDVCERNNLRNDAALEAVVRVLASSVGSLTNPARLANTFKSSGQRGIDAKTVKAYIDHLQEAFLIEHANRYDIKGKRYISTPLKYYFCDVGVRNAALGFRQQEETHLMENVLFNELLTRGYSVDVGVVELIVKNSHGDSVRTHLEIDFVCNQADQRFYVQSAFALPDSSKTQQEMRPLAKVDDSFKKIVVVKDDIRPWRTEQGILVMGLWDFLLDENSPDY